MCALVISGAGGVAWYSGAGAPAAGLGASGDFYLDTTPGDIYQKGAGGWVLVVSISSGGATWYTGAGPPSSGLGSNGDYYLQTGNGVVWNKLAGTWTRLSSVSTTSSSGYWDAIAQLGSDQTTTNLTATAIPGLSLAGVAGGVYEVEVRLRIASSTTAGNKYQVGWDAGGSSGGFIFIGGQGAGGNITPCDNGPGSLAVQAYCTQNTRDAAMEISGLITGGGSNSNITVSHAKVTSGTATARAGSTLKIKRLS